MIVVETIIFVNCPHHFIKLVKKFFAGFEYINYYK